MKITCIILLAFLTTVSFGQTKKSKTTDQSKVFALGLIDEIQSKELSEKRIINIYLPEGYNKNDTTRYPVVYLLDGSADEDFIHIVGLYQFNSFPWINRVPKSIIVGIANVDRKRDFTYPTTIEADKKRYPTTGHSDRFIAFVENELQPYIQNLYKTNTSKTLIGQSLAGLLATEILLEKPNLFSQYIIISPSLWWNDGSLLKANAEALTQAVKSKKGIYIGVGKEGLGPSDIPHVMEVDVNLLVEKLMLLKNKNLQINFDYLPQEDHATITHQAVFNALRLLNPASSNKP